jgi:putative inorganic carbon (HCO3(-)) transporter
MNSRTNKSWWAQATHNRLIALVLAMLVVVPLVATPAETAWHGAAAFAYEGLALILLAVLLWRSRWTLTRPQIQQFFKIGSHLPVALYGAFAALSVLVAGRNGYGAQALLCLGAGILLYYTVATQFRRSEQLAKLVDTLAFITIGASLLGFAQYSGGHSMQAIGLFGDHQLFGSFLMILLPLVGVQAVTEKHPGRQLVAQVASIFGVTALLISQARSAWIGAVAGLALLAVLTMVVGARTRKSAAPRHETVLPLMMLAVAAAFFLMLWPQTAQLFSRATSIQKMTAVQTWNIRQHTWHGAWKMFGAHPVLGNGFGQYVVKQQHYTHEGMPLNGFMQGASLSEQAHNFYLQTMAELGVVGLLLFASILITFWVMGMRRVLTMDAGIRRSLLLGSLASTVAVAVDAYASPSWQLGQVSMFLWLTLGLGVCCMQRRTRAEEAEEAKAVVAPARITRPTAVLATAAIALLLPTVVFAGGGGYNHPVSAALRPKNAVIRSGQSENYTLLVVFTDDNGHDITVDVSTSPDTTFTYMLSSGGGAPGTTSGVNNRVYTAGLTEKDTVIPTGTYTQNGYASVSDSGVLLVR